MKFSSTIIGKMSDLRLVREIVVQKNTYSFVKHVLSM